MRETGSVLAKVIFSFIFLVPIAILSTIEPLFIRFLCLLFWVPVSLFLIQPYVYKRF